jgi:hypothetical protein
MAVELQEFRLAPPEFDEDLVLFRARYLHRGESPGQPPEFPCQRTLSPEAQPEQTLGDSENSAGGGIAHKRTWKGAPFRGEPEQVP